jgi:hypothetical protein
VERVGEREERAYRASPQVRIRNRTFETEHDVAGLPVVAGVTTAHEAVGAEAEAVARSKIVVVERCEIESGIARRVAGVQTDVETAPVIGHHRRYRRLGVRPRSEVILLFYVKGGVAFTELHTRIQDTADYNERNATKTGWTVGGGVEWMVSPNWIVGVEGNYYDFGHCCGGLSFNRSLATNALLASTSNHSVRFDDWSVLGRVSYKFGAPVVAKY